MEIYRYLRIARRRAWMIVVFPLVGALIATYMTSRMPRIYEASADVLLRPASGSSVSTMLLPDQAAANYAKLMTSDPVMQLVIQDLGLQASPGGLAGEISISQLSGTTILEITVKDTDPDRARRIADSVSKQFVAYNVQFQQQKTKDQLASLQDKLANLESKIGAEVAQQAALESNKNPTSSDTSSLFAVQNQIATDRTNLADLVQQISNLNNLQIQFADTFYSIGPAKSSGVPVSPNPQRNLILGLAIGLVTSIGVAFVLEYLDTTIKSDDEVTERTGLSPIGHIPYVESKAGRRGEMAAVQGSHIAAEAYKALRTNVMLSGEKRTLRTLVVTSPLAHEGKSRTASMLAASLAAAGHDTLLVDADFRRASMHKVFGTRSRIGLANLVREDHILDEDIGMPVADQPHLYILTAGPRPNNPSELLGSDRMKELLARMRFRFRYIVLDTPPVNAVTDSTLLAAEADATLIVIEQGRTTHTDLMRTVGSLERVNAHIVGVVVNKLRPRDGAYKSYYYPYEYRATAPRELEPVEPEKVATPVPAVWPHRDE